MVTQDTSDFDNHFWWLVCKFFYHCVLFSITSPLHVRTASFLAFWYQVGSEWHCFNHVQGSSGKYLLPLLGSNNPFRHHLLFLAGNIFVCSRPHKPNDKVVEKTQIYFIFYECTRLSTKHLNGYEIGIGIWVVKCEATPVLGEAYWHLVLHAKYFQPTVASFTFASGRI